MRDKPEYADYYAIDSSWIHYPIEVTNWTGYDTYKLQVIVSQFTECKRLDIYNGLTAWPDVHFGGFIPTEAMKLFLPPKVPLIRTYELIKAIQSRMTMGHDYPPESAHTKLLEYIGYNLINFRPRV